jgi:hypothetical protein
LKLESIDHMLIPNMPIAGFSGFPLSSWRLHQESPPVRLLPRSGARGTVKFLGKCQGKAQLTGIYIRIWNSITAA